MNALWADDGLSAVLVDDVGNYTGRLLVNRWYEPGDQTPRLAWVAEYLDDRELLSVFVADADAIPDESGRGGLLSAARTAIAQGPPTLATPDLPASDFGDELDLLFMAWGDAHQRLRSAAERTDEHAREHIYVALTELVSWTCTIDDVLQAVWKGFSPAFREAKSVEVDQAVARVISRNKQQAKEHCQPYVEGPAGIFDAYRARRLSGKSYAYWSQLLALKHVDLDPRFLSGLKWIRGKFVHRGVLHAVDLRQWRPGVEPRWKWLPSSQTGQGAHGSDKMKMENYDAVVAGKDVLGSLGLTGELLDTVWLFTALNAEHSAASAASR